MKMIPEHSYTTKTRSMKKTNLTIASIGLLLCISSQVLPREKLEFQESTLSKRLIPQGRILEDPNYFIWGCSPVYGADSTVHVFYARWPAEKGFEGWKGPRSWIAHAIAENPEGPYKTVEEKIGLSDLLSEHAGRSVWVHNPEIHKVGQNYVLLYNWNYTKSHKRSRKIGLAFANSLYGPWSVEPNIIECGPKGSWDHVTVLNPTLLQHPDGRFFVYYRTWDKNHDDQFGVAVAEDIEGPYIKYKENPIIDPTRIVNGATAGLEDPFAFIENGKIHILARDYGLLRNRNTPHDEGSGLLFSSKDGLHFSHVPQIAYHGTLHYYDESDFQTGPRWWRFERPKLLQKKGKPVYLFNALGGGKGGTSTGHVFKIN